VWVLVGSPGQCWNIVTLPEQGLENTKTPGIKPFVAQYQGFSDGGGGGNRTHVRGFAGPCL
jgi:hypothetical protein